MFSFRTSRRRSSGKGGCLPQPSLDVVRLEPRMMLNGDPVVVVDGGEGGAAAEPTPDAGSRSNDSQPAPAAHDRAAGERFSVISPEIQNPSAPDSTVTPNASFRPAPDQPQNDPKPRDEPAPRNDVPDSDCNETPGEVAEDEDQERHDSAADASSIQPATVLTGSAPQSASAAAPMKEADRPTPDRDCPHDTTRVNDECAAPVELQMVSEETEPLAVDSELPAVPDEPLMEEPVATQAGGSPAETAATEDMLPPVSGALLLATLGQPLTRLSSSIGTAAAAGSPPPAPRSTRRRPRWPTDSADWSDESLRKVSRTAEVTPQQIDLALRENLGELESSEAPRKGFLARAIGRDDPAALRSLITALTVSSAGAIAVNSTLAWWQQRRKQNRIEPAVPNSDLPTQHW